MKGRIKFHREDGTIGESPGCGSILVAFGEENAETLRSSNIEGRYIQVNQEPCNTHVDWEQRKCDALFDIDGRGNTERLVARNPKLKNLLKDGEYIPSLGQLNLMAHYMDELNKAFTYVSASPLSSTWYWSSTESSQAVAWYMVFSSGLTGTGNKHIGDMVRAVIDF